MCVLCWEAWFTHIAAERTCQIKGDSVVLLELLEQKAGKIDGNQQPGNILRTHG